MNDLVSVIIPVYNVEQYLKQCLDSVINQTFKDIEIILINDCSTDNSLQIIKEYQKKDNRIVLVNLKQNIGLGFARNAGLKVAKGKYITFIDSDDWVKNNYIEVLYTNICKYKSNFVSGDHIKYDNITSIFSENELSSNFDFYNTIIDKENIKQKILLNIPAIQVWAKIFEKDFLFMNNIYFKINKLEDNLFMWEVILKSKKFIFLNDKLYYYRKNRTASIMTANYTEMITYEFELFEQLKNMLIETQYYLKYKKYFFSFISLNLIILLKNYNLNYKISKTLLTKFKNLYYKDGEYILANNYNSIKLLTLKFCLKHNYISLYYIILHYIIFNKLYIKLKLIKKQLLSALK